MTELMHRRPSGEKPPLPKEFGRADFYLIVISIVVIAVLVVAGTTNRYSGWLDALDKRLVSDIVRLRSTATVDMAHTAAFAGAPGFFAAISGLVALSLVLLRRTRRLVVFLVVLVAAYSAQALLAEMTRRVRPFGIEILGNWAGYSFPSDSVTPLAALLLGACFCYFAKGFTRRLAAGIAVALLAALGFAQVLLGVDHPTDVIAGILLSATITVIAFRAFVPDALFPVTSHTNTAHLELSGTRGAAIRSAVADQLGFEVHEVRPFGQEGSAGSTPMLLIGESKRFAKLYATSHVRSDRIYKLVRTLRYGRLEDEVPFQSVRRLVEYEDYLMRLMAEAGVPVVKTYGIVELTPEREYLLVTDFVDGASEIGDPGIEVNEAIIDRVLRAVRSMWDAGLSHRDLKPANLLVRGNEVFVIDVAFGSVRPTPWRQAVDLANAMLLLALKTDTERVYGRAREFFSDDEIAEAIAATKGATVPSQLRSMIREDGRDLVGELRRRAGNPEPIPIQRWSVRRVALLAGVSLVVFLGSILVTEAVVGPERGQVAEPGCPDSPSVVLAAQSVPTAESIVCSDSLPAGWTKSDVVITDAGMRLTYDNDRSGASSLVVDFTPDCDVSGMAPVPGSVPRAYQTEEPDGGIRRVAVVNGGCAVSRFRKGAPEAEAVSIIGWVSRSDLGDYLAERTGGAVSEV